MKLSRLLTPALTLALLFTSLTVTAQPGSGAGKKGDQPHRMWADLDLNEKQKGELKTLHEEMQTIREKHMKAIRTLRDKIKLELLKEKPSQNVLYGYAGELGELHKNMTKDRSDHLLKVKKILTPEQFLRVVEHEGRGCKGEGGCAHKGGPGCCPGGAGFKGGPHGKGGCPRHMGNDGN